MTHMNKGDLKKYLSNPNTALSYRQVSFGPFFINRFSKGFKILRSSGEGNVLPGE